MMGICSYFKNKSKNILNCLIAFEKNGEVLDYGTLCIKTFRVHGFDIILITTMTFFLMKLLPGSPLKTGEAITGTKRNHS